MEDNIFFTARPFREWPVRDLIDYRYALKLLEPKEGTPLRDQWLLALGMIAQVIKESSFSQHVRDAVVKSYEHDEHE